MEDSFEVKSALGESIVIQVLSCHSTHSPHDYQWCSSEVVFSIGAFKGRFAFHAVTGDFARFLKSLEELYSTLGGSAAFQTMEGQVEIVLKVNGRGQIIVCGYLFDNHYRGNKLEYNMESDQTFLPTLIEQMRRLVSKFEKGSA